MELGYGNSSEIREGRVVSEKLFRPLYAVFLDNPSG
jgi:hypothetical protein